MKKVLSLVLVIVMLFSTFAGLRLGVSAAGGGKQASALQQGETFYMGRWPQSRVSDSSLLSSLNALSVKLWSYEYKHSAQSETNYKIVDISFGDVAYGGEVFRKVVLNQYRPYRTEYGTDSSNSEQGNNGYTTGNTYWFRWDPVKWRTLKAESDGTYVMSDILLDSQPYNDIYKSITWAESTIRAWLAKNFYQSAFSANEKGKILSYYHQNENSPWNSSASGGAATTDKIWVLSYSDAINSAYGFSSSSSAYDTARRAQGSDYAKSQGLWVCTSSYYYRGKSCWWLRSPGKYSYGATLVKADGDASILSSDVIRTCSGVRPAFKIHPSSILSGSADPAEVGRIFHGSISGAGQPVTERTYGAGENFLNKTIFFKEEAKDSYKSALVTFRKEWFQTNDEYIHGLAQFCAQYSMFGYSPDHSTKKKENTYIKTCLENGGFTVLDSNMNAARDEVNYFLAAKTIHLGGKRKQLLFVGTIGSNKEQWYSNFDPEGRGRKNGKGRETGKHCGFEDAKDFMVNKINGILFNGSYGFSKDNTILLFTGHSRGAATANLLAASAVNENAAWANADSVFAYTFATPNNTLAKDYKTSKYSFIHNIVNPEDMVTHVMMKDTWKYHKYGKIYVLPSKTNTSSAKYKSYLTRMNHFYKNYKNDEYEPYTRGEAATHSIIQEFNKNMKSVDDFYSKKYYYKGVTWLEPYEFFKKTLLPYVANVSKESKDEGYDNMIDVLLWNPLGFYFDIVAYFANPDIDFSNQHGYELGMGGNFEQAHAMHTYCSYMQALNFDEITAKRDSKYGSWNCPVDIEIYDNTTNELVGRIQNNTIDKEIEAKENSVVMTVDGDTKSYYLPADGDYTVKVIGNDNGTADYTLATLGEDNNELERVNYYDIPVAKSKEMSATVQPEATAASVTLRNDNQQVIASDEVFENSQEAACNVSVNVTGSGFVSGDGEAKIGDYAELTATAQCSTFLGWYSGGNCVSTDLVYKFRVMGDTSLSAKFSEGSHNYKEIVTKATCADKGTTEKVCENCGVSTLISETPALGHDYIAHEAQEPTCEESGWEAYQTCSRCEYSTYCELPAYGHVWGEWSVTKSASCTETGVETRVCSNDASHKETREIAVLGHDATLKMVVEPQATQLGYTVHSCSRCGETQKFDSYTAPTAKLTLKHSARTANAIKVLWNNVKTATGYQVQISNAAGNKWSTYANLKAGVTSHTFKGLVAGNNYKFRVRFYIKAADKKNYFSPWSATLNSPTLPKGTAVKLFTAKKAFTAKWTKIAGVTGYQVQYATNAKFRKAVTKTVKGASKYSLAVKNLTGGARYYVRIRTYKTIGGKNYFSAWSPAKAVTTKR